jgi:hypothetical protein
MKYTEVRIMNFRLEGRRRVGRPKLQDRGCIGREIWNRGAGYSPGRGSPGTKFYGKPDLILDCSTTDDTNVLDCHQHYLSAVISILNEKSALKHS